MEPSSASSHQIHVDQDTDDELEEMFGLKAGALANAVEDEAVGGEGGGGQPEEEEDHEALRRLEKMMFDGVDVKALDNKDNVSSFSNLPSELMKSARLLLEGQYIALLEVRSQWMDGIG